MHADEKPHLVMSGEKNEPLAYRCSLCGQLFLLPDDRSPKDAAVELLAAFQEHVAEAHAEEAKE